MQVTEGPLAGLLIIQPRVFKDERGHLFEAFQDKRYAAFGIPPFVQDNFSHSTQHVLRGLHYQLPQPQGKLVSVLHGSAWDVAVDIRRHSPTFGKWFGITLSADNQTQVYIPPGFAHGFCVLSPEVSFHYKCTDYYTPQAEHGIIWNDPIINITWPVRNPIISTKDATYLTLSEMSDEYLFT